MHGQSSMFGPETSGDTSNAISSPGLEDGLTPFDLLGGATIGPSGPGVVTVSRSPWREQARARLTKETSGLSFGDSSPSATLSLSLGNRLRERMANYGSLEYSLTWKRSRIASGLPISVLRASERRTSGKGFTGWPTARAEDSEQTGGHRGKPDTLTSAARTLNGWPTPKVQNANGAGAHGEGGRDLQTTAQLVGWPTTTTMDHIERKGLRPSRTATNRTGGYIAEVLAGWATPTTRDHKDERSEGTVPVNGLLGRQVWSSNAETESTGVSRLNPLFSLWLMGYPAEWGYCGAPVTPSSRTSRRSS